MGNRLSLVASTSAPPAEHTRLTRVLLAAVIRNAFGEQAVRIREISGEAALIEGAFSAQVGSRVFLVREQMSVLAKIIWMEAGKIFLEFDEQIDPKRLMIVVPQASTPDSTAKVLFPSPQLRAVSVTKQA